jgi:hypothetical protein
MMKAYPSMTPDYILYEMSYVNMALYSSILPPMDSPKSKKENSFDESTDANDPDNFNNDETETVVKS